MRFSWAALLLLLLVLREFAIKEVRLDAHDLYD